MASKCTTCYYKFNTVDELETHLEIEHGQACPQCASSQCRCRNNVQWDNLSPKQPSYSCGKCDYSFLTNEELEKHISVRERNNCINCNQC